MKKVLISLLLGVSMVTMVGCGNNSKEVFTDEEIDSLEIGETIEVNGIFDDYGAIDIIVHYLEDDTYEEDSLWIEDYDGIDLEDGCFYNIKLKKIEEHDYEIIKAKEIEGTDKAKSIFKGLIKIYNKLEESSLIFKSNHEDEYYDLEEELNDLDISNCGMEELQPYFDRAKEKLVEIIEFGILGTRSGNDTMDCYLNLEEISDIIDFIEECLY